MEEGKSELHRVKEGLPSYVDHPIHPTCHFDKVH